jgi:uncharacterized repeat protein (TIGR03803 family)
VAVLHDFSKAGDARYPSSGVIMDASGALYGVTPTGGANKYGAVYKIAAPVPGHPQPAETILYSFAGGSDGFSPVGGLVMDKAGALYGTTESGGDHFGGTVFQLSPPPAGVTDWVKTTLHSFAGMGGSDPQAALILDKRGILYGTAFGGGSAGWGAVFALHPPKSGVTKWRNQVLYSFPSSTVGCPVAALTFSKDANSLYGTSLGCNTEGKGGAVFALKPPVGGESAWTESTLHDFSQDPNATAWAPHSTLVTDDAGALYGTTANQLGNLCETYGGTVFQLSPPLPGQTTWNLTIIHQFVGPPYNTDGQSPAAGLLRDAHGALYGTTCNGGSESQGTIYKLQPPAAGQSVWPETVLSLLYTGPIAPLAGLIPDQTGTRLITTSLYGGTDGLGTVFSVTP